MDFEFYLRLPNFIKRRAPLVNIGGGDATPEDWLAVCDEVAARYRKQEGV